MYAVRDEALLARTECNDDASVNGDQFVCTLDMFDILDCIYFVDNNVNILSLGHAFMLGS